MDLGYVDMCAKRYEGKLEGPDAQRLRFFRGLWQVMDASVRSGGEVPYRVPPLDELKELYREQRPVFAAHPCTVDPQRFAEVARAIVAYLQKSGAYESALIDALESFDWASLISCMDAARQQGEADDPFERSLAALGDGRAAHLAALVATLALYAFYEEPARAVMAAIGFDEVVGEHPLRCPVCGGEPTLSSVGERTSSAGRGRLLYCSDCGAAWEFDRVRCAHCGTRDQTKLRYVSREGDEDHRLALCEECGATMRTVFLESELFPISSLVEDVVMAPLTAIGAEHSLRDTEGDHDGR